MKTAIETDKEGKPLRVYHRAGSTPAQGPDTRYAWTHSIEEKKTCSLCVKGTIPATVKAGGPR